MDLKTMINNPSAVRGSMRSERQDEYVFDDVMDYNSFVAREVFQSSMKYKDIAAGHMASTTVRNLASGKTKYPRFSTIFGIIGALGQEVVIRGGARK